MTTRPLCLHCRKPLPKFTALEHIDAAEDPKSLVGRQHDWAGVIRQVTRAYTPSLNGQRMVSVWCGDYGRNGDNLFCDKSCGYLWAVRCQFSDCVERFAPDDDDERSQAYIEGAREKYPRAGRRPGRDRPG